MNILDQFLGHSLIFLRLNVIGERKKHKAQVELLQLRIPPHLRELIFFINETLTKLQKKNDPLLIF